MSLTPIRVRGKRHGQAAEKYASRPRRKLVLQQASLRPSMINGNKALRLTRLGRWEHRDHPDADYAPLERLPPELIQSIFIYSSNLDMPAASRAIYALLSNSKHLQLKMMEGILRPVLQDPEGKAPQVALTNATRMLNSRFVSWGLFTTWLHNSNSLQEPPTLSSSEPLAPLELQCQAWAALKPSPALLVPRKLLHAPFSAGRTSLLTVLSQTTDDLPARSPLSAEVAREGLAQGVRENNKPIVKLFFGMGLRGDVDLLCVALIQEPLDHAMVRLIVAHSGAESGWARDEDVMAGENIDLLDPRLWRAAEKRGEQESAWLIAFLRGAQRRKERNG